MANISTAPEHINNAGKPLDDSNRMQSFKYGESVGLVDIFGRQLDLPGAITQEDFLTVTDEFKDLFSNPEKRHIMEKHAGPYISQEEADARVQSWKENALNQGKSMQNSGKVVISLFDHTGQWSDPWLEAGYDVYRFDIQDGHDINDFCVEYLNENYDFCDVYAILAACPCTDFSASGNKWHAEKDADGRTEASKELVFQTIRTIEYLRPTIWALENPVGRIRRLTGLPEPRLSFNPNHFGENYTKKTMLWGRFNEELPSAHRPATLGSKMHTKYGGKSIATKNARSETPIGFSYAFFQANNYLNMPVHKRLPLEYPEISGAVTEALNAGMDQQDIIEVIQDYYLDENYEQALQDLAAELRAPRLFR